MKRMNGKPLGEPHHAWHCQVAFVLAMPEAQEPWECVAFGSGMLPQAISARTASPGRESRDPGAGEFSDD